MNSYFEIPGAVAEFYMESVSRAFQAVTLAGEQSDKAARMFLDNSKTAREEGVKFAQRWAELARENQKAVVNSFNAATKAGYSNYKNASQQAIDELTKQVATLNKQMESFAPAPAPAGKAAKG